MTKKTASPGATWAVLMEAAAKARIEVERLRHFAERATKLVDASPNKDQIYMVAGDIVQAVPRRLDDLEGHITRLTYALSVIGKEELRDRLSMDDRAFVDDAMHGRKLMASRVAVRAAVTWFDRYRVARVASAWLDKQADKSPALGFPGGPCHLMKRVEQEISNPRLRAELIEDVEQGAKWTNADAAQVYDLEVERGPNRKFAKMVITAHAQYRMDQRGITVPELRLFFAAFTKAWGDAKSRQDYMWRSWEEDMARREKIVWTEPHLGLTVAFVLDRADVVRVITCYWEGQPDPRPVQEESCRV